MFAGRGELAPLGLHSEMMRGINCHPGDVAIRGLGELKPWIAPDVLAGNIYPQLESGPGLESHVNCEEREGVQRTLGIIAAEVLPCPAWLGSGPGAC